jgi:hypothetical protein
MTILSFNASEANMCRFININLEQRLRKTISFQELVEFGAPWWFRLVVGEQLTVGYRDDSEVKIVWKGSIYTISSQHSLAKQLSKFDVGSTVKVVERTTERYKHDDKTWMRFVHKFEIVK